MQILLLKYKINDLKSSKIFSNALLNKKKYSEMSNILLLIYLLLRFTCGEINWHGFKRQGFRRFKSERKYKLLNI